VLFRSSTKFIYHQGELLYERTGEEETSYHLGNGIEGLGKNQQLFYYHRDEQRSTAYLSDPQGRIQNEYRYGAFGELKNYSEKILNRIRYTGQQYDELTGQYYLRARYYHPTLGRFLQEDVNQNDGLNLYAYCENNPVIYYDPSGYVCEWAKINGDGSSNKNLKDFNEKIKTGKDVNITIDSITGLPVGTIYVDPKGNAMISPVGGGINPKGLGYKGLDIETTYPNGSSYQRNNPNGHATMPGQNHGHGHLLGTGPGKGGTGPSLDLNGNIVDFRSKEAHWSTKK
jgi:RHS repeat-associated protein